MNYLSPLNALVDRLKATVPAGLAVRSAVDSAQMEDMAMGQPEIWVLFHRDSVKGAVGPKTLVEQQYAVVYLSPGVLPDMQRDGEVLTAITKALAGYQPALPGVNEFQRVGSMVPQSLKNTLVGYGMLFGTSVSL